MDNHFSLPRSRPEQQGIASGDIQAFIRSIRERELELHSFMLLRHGHVVAEGWWNPYSAELPHMLFSLSKSFTSSAIGLAVAEGVLTLDDQVISFFPEELPSGVSENLAKMRIRHLLTMSTGQAADTINTLWNREDGNWIGAFLDTPAEHEPGAHFVYNTGATYVLSAILQKATGQKLLDYLKPRLLDPLHIAGAVTESCPRGIHTGGYGIKITTEDIAKFGQLYLQRGIWHGQRIIPETWITEATARQISNGDGKENDWTQGYGYQFWLCLPSGAYRADGAFGQLCIVMPEQDAVIAITSATENTPLLLHEIWNILLPAMKPAPLAPNESAAAGLREELSRLRHAPARSLANSPREAELSERRFALDENAEQWTSFSIHFSADRATVALESGQNEHIIQFGRETWIAGTTTLFRGCAERIAASFTWKDEATLELTMRYVETPYIQTLLCRVAGNELLLERTFNVLFGSMCSMSVHGRSA